MRNLIFYKLAGKKENFSNTTQQRFLRNMPNKEGYNKVYMPYGKYGRGFYYVKKED